MATITCTVCNGTGLLNAVTCTTCGGTGTVSVDITDIDPDSITGDSNVDIDPSDYSAFLFVPENGNNASKTPGVLLRLGSYCEIEAEADSEDKAKVLYPEEFVSAASDKSKAYAEASGSTDKGGILLSCDGHLLIKACEKTFIRSENDINIEGGEAITIRSNQNSGEVNEIIMDDDDGGLTIKTPKTETKYKAGTKLEYTEKDSLTYNKGNTVGFTEGSKTFVTFGSSNSMYFGAGFDVNAAATVTLSLGLNFKCSAALTLSLAAVSCDFTLFKFSKDEVKVDKTAVEVDQNILDLTNALTKLENNSVKLANENLNLARRNFDLLQSQIDVNRRNIGLNSEQISVNKTDLMHLIF